jgi:hypothetical protein
VDELDAELVVAVAPVVAVGKVEGIDIPAVGVVALPDDIQAQFVGAGDLGAATLKELESPATNQ